MNGNRGKTDRSMVPGTQSTTVPEAASQPQRVNRVRAKRMQSIMDAAEIEFASKGLRGTSVQSIADRAGLQKRQVLYFFNSKESLYTDVIDRIFREWRSLSPSDREGSPKAVISDYIDHIFLQAETKPHQSKLLVSEMLSGGAFGIEAMERRGSRSIVARSIALLEGYMDEGVMRRTDPLAFLFQIWSAQHFYVAFSPEVAFLLDKDQMDREDWTRFRDQTKAFALSFFED